MGRKSTTPTTASLVESLDTLDSKEAKKQRRLLRNRLSAQLHRERQRSYMTGLQKQVAALTAERDLWRNAVDAMTVKASVASGMHPEELLGDLQLPLPAEQIAPPPQPPTGQAARNADGLDTMADVMAHAQTSILPRGKASASAVVNAAAGRCLAVAADAAAALDMRPRPSKRRGSHVSGSCSDDSDDTAMTSLPASARTGSPAASGTASLSDAGPATRRRSARSSKRPALATATGTGTGTALAHPVPSNMSRGLSYLSVDDSGLIDGAEANPFGGGHALPSADGQASASAAVTGHSNLGAVLVMPDHAFPLSFNAIDQGDVADEDDDDDTDSVLLTPHAVLGDDPLAPPTALAAPASRPTLAVGETDPVTALLIDELEDVDDVASLALPFAAASSSSGSHMAATAAAFGPTPNASDCLIGLAPGASNGVVAALC